jgi:predicted N-acyltransferase
MGDTNYVTRVCTTPDAIDVQRWDALLHLQLDASPFMRHAYLAALHHSGSACATTGWEPHYITLDQGGELVAACVVYLKTHSYGEYVFDWAWASAYQQHGLQYYPKAVIAVPFTPVPGPRLLAVDARSRQALLHAVLAWCDQAQVSSLHLLFASDADVHACKDAQLMLRHTVQFHWTNGTGKDTTRSGELHRPQKFSCFENFLASLSQDKRKKIRQERRKVREAGVTFRHVQGADISTADWDFFYRCYSQTYREHGNPPYLTRDFFHRMEQTMPEHWLLFIAELQGRPIASSLIAIGADSTWVSGQFDAQVQSTAYGRYWGALQRVDCLHFEACYYQPLQWCIENGYHRFEGGAQGEHKMARALMPVQTTSAHWIARPDFADAIARFLEREAQGIDNYMEDLEQRSPFKPTPPRALKGNNTERD